MRHTIYRAMGLVVIGSLLLPTPAVPVLAGAVHTPIFRSADSETRSFGGATEARASRSESIADVNAAVTVAATEFPPVSSLQSVTMTATIEAILAVSGAGQDSWSNWSQIAICETGGNWTVEGPVHSGGLGFDNGSWRAYAPNYYPRQPGLASPVQQMTVGNIIDIQNHVTYHAQPDCVGWRGW